MKTAEEIAQWVINNRYPKNENEKISDFEMYNKLVNLINSINFKFKNYDIVKNSNNLFLCVLDDFVNGSSNFNGIVLLDKSKEFEIFYKSDHWDSSLFILSNVEELNDASKHD